MSRTSRNSARRALPALGLGAVLAALTAFPAAATDLYQWKDAQGVTHYSDSPPPGQSGSGQVKNRVIRNKSGTASQTAAIAATGESSQCVSARANLKQLQSSAQVGVDSNGDGKPDNVLDTQQRAAQVQLAEASIRAYCTPGPSNTPSAPDAPRPAGGEKKADS
ncbi:DUF4124 domain-containing protein [Lysobacter sp. K5869]|uniref:DUF4124 domain-containing protein n=1 Tax=Lysobacter sp. K5869 TaxID=2820808 RepID=UPI001C060CF9|nr:DUF4124 domain-containing protein [Lysobacter sp. K5869]QWP78569.1 DUF4124 domain-containing protein [Lysobacter sp. K5869]